MKNKPTFPKLTCNPISLSMFETFTGTPHEQKLIGQVIDEWNSYSSIYNICERWRKNCPVTACDKMLFLLYNVERLNTHIADVDILLDTYEPHICILTGIDTAVKKLPEFTGYNSIAQEGSNSFGGVAILHNNKIKLKVLETQPNAIITEIMQPNSKIRIGAIYVPPSSLPPLDILSKYQDEPYVFFGDYNAKHCE